jgi:hypothetical protein
MISLKELHDAVLIDLKISWENAELQFTFGIFDASTGGEKTVKLLARGFTSLKCPRNQPWGPSIFVNEIRTDKLDKEILLTIEMQSGDVIEASVRDMTFD